MTKVFRTALYLRLSKDDETGGESASIATQRSLLTDYAAAHDLEIVSEFADDGYSGTNFNRPGFCRLTAAIEAGEINCVLTKDLSRLGRNGARTADLLDEFFPQYGVRFIAVLDGFDSFAASRGSAMTASLMSVVNEWYARDISEKIRSSLHTKMQNGAYIGSFAPYGYRKMDKNHLEIDPQTGPIVRMLFDLAADGMAPGQLAARLNHKRVAAPSVYRRTGCAYLAADAEAPVQWTSSGICKLLRNECYLGNTLQGKTAKVSFKQNVTRRIPREDWICAENTHAALVPKGVFDRVRQRSVARRCAPTGAFINLFSGIAVCADCGRAMTPVVSHRKGVSCNLCCSGYKTHGKAACSSHLIDYDTLCDLVFEDLQSHLRYDSDALKTLLYEIAAEEAAVYDPMQRETIRRMQHRQKELHTIIKKLYEAYALERISKDSYETLFCEYNLESKEIAHTLLQMTKQKEVNICEMQRKLVDLMKNKSIIRAMIERIEIGESDKRTENMQRTITICYRFSPSDTQLIP